MQIRPLQQNNLYTKNSNQLKNNSFNGAPKNSPSFKGGANDAYDGLTTLLAKGINKLVDTKTFSNITKKVGGLKYKNKDIWFPSIVAAESLWLSTFYTISAYRNPKYEKKQKQTEAVYQTLTTIFCAVGAFTIDHFVNDIMDNFTKTFKKYHNKEAMNKLVETINKKNLAKNIPETTVEKTIDSCTNGIKQLKTIVIFATIYRFIGPVVMNPIANKISGHFQNKAKLKNENNKPTEENKKNIETKKAP